MNKRRTINIIVAALYLISLLAVVQPALADGTTDTIIVKKTAVATFSRLYKWTIEKGADQSSVTLSPGQVLTVNYWVKVTATPVDSGWSVSGDISFRNAFSTAVTVSSVTDEISPDGIHPAVNCPFTFPYDLPAGWASPLCTYSADLPDGSDRTNTATVNTSDPAGGSFTHTVPVTFSSTPSVTDECITVNDSKYGDLGTVCASDSPKTFHYSLNIGPYNTCGTYKYKNTATFTTNDTKTTGSASWTIDIDVPCAGGCTLTPGYWKTHSSHGPAPYDNTWALIGENTPFFLSGKTWYQTINTAPLGNAYYILSFQYIAARLNILNGASAPANVQSAITDATLLFTLYTPAEVGAWSGSEGMRPLFISLAATLANYNTGLIGPGHCTQ